MHCMYQLGRSSSFLYTNDVMSQFLQKHKIKGETEVTWRIQGRRRQSDLLKVFSFLFTSRMLYNNCVYFISFLS